jgi:CubicO group peptidase (beta-lactamase class C family)
MAAAMQGGVAGHAGIFSNAMDIAKMMQMYLQKGNYGGIEYFKPSTFDTFNTCYFCSEGNRRGLGFDKPNGYPNHLKSDVGSHEHYTAANIFDNAPETLFGHSGFTGNWAWADPENELVFIFLSNRTYPTDANNALIKEGVRGKLLKTYYSDLEKN